MITLECNQLFYQVSVVSISDLRAFIITDLQIIDDIDYTINKVEG